MKSLNFEGKVRKVGFEIEYIGIPIGITAQIIADLFSGTIQEKNENLIVVETNFGPFQLEIDVYLLETLAQASKKNIEENKIDVEGAAQYILSNLLTAFMPNEIVCPPVPFKEIPILEQLVEELRKKGAKGTSASFAYAFGLHINIEPHSLKPLDLLQYIRAFILLYDYLKEIMQIDATRTITLFAKGYSLDYAKFVLQKNYTPDQSTLIDDYIFFNNSRNYALDALPLFSYLDQKKVEQKIRDPRIKPRPTFHFRMPNCKIDSVSWNISGEWEHWLLVEKLVSREDLFEQMRKIYLQLKVPVLHHFSKEWLKESKKFIDQL